MGAQDYADMVSEVRYARSGDVHIAYRVAGEGPFDVVLVPGTTSHVELAWEVPFIEFEDRGTAELKGIPGNWRLFAVAKSPVR